MVFTSAITRSAPSDQGWQSGNTTSSTRPQFNSQRTSDRLREGSGLQTPAMKMAGKIRKDRISIFKEVGLDDDELAATAAQSPIQARRMSFPSNTRSTQVEANTSRASSEWKPSSSENELHQLVEESEPEESAQNNHQHRRQSSSASQPWYSKLALGKTRPRVKSASGAPPKAVFGLQRFALITVLICVVLPAFSFHNAQSATDISGANAGVIQKREDSPTDVCTRWAHQAAHVNGTVYIYGGEAKKDEGQEENTWNNHFLTLDLTKDWSIDDPPLKGLPIPNGPPAVAMGYLWQDYNNLYLYGGQFSDSPYVDPGPESVWQYSIKAQSWTEFSNPLTSQGNYSGPAKEPVHRAAEGAGLSVPELGLSWYFGGHLDWATTPGWSHQIDRVYLKSLLEFTHPGFVNSGVDDLSSGTGAGAQGAFRNITTGGVQAGEFPERADGVLVYVPGWGEMGVLIGLAGGTDSTFTHDLKNLDVYDLANSEWYHQETDGDIPDVRVNPCGVVAAASDASSFQIYMFGGQNLQPYEQQIQYNDMYILSIPAFTWIKVEADDSTPHPRAGHTCTMRDGQVIVIGGYVGEDVACDSPGIYVFDASELKWKTEFKAGDHEADFHPENSVLAGSYGYTVPEVVQEVIGGDGDGGATATIPAVGEPSEGPFATGVAPVITITNPGATATVSAPAGEHDNGGNDDDGGGGGTNQAGLIAAGVIAGLAGLLAGYLGFCAWVYRRQVGKYKQHLAVSNRYSAASVNSIRTPGIGGAGAAAGLFGGKKVRRSRRGRDSREHESGESFAWVGSDREPTWLSEPKWYSDDTSPGYMGSGTASGSASAQPKYSEDTAGGRRSSGSGESTEGLLEGQEPSFFNVVLGPRRALRVVNGLD